MIRFKEAVTVSFLIIGEFRFKFHVFRFVSDENRFSGGLI